MGSPSPPSGAPSPPPQHSLNRLLVLPLLGSAVCPAAACDGQSALAKAPGRLLPLPQSPGAASALLLLLLGAPAGLSPTSTQGPAMAASQAASLHGPAMAASQAASLQGPAMAASQAASLQGPSMAGPQAASLHGPAAGAACAAFSTWHTSPC
jgi:hypothetical protein